ncbi:MAG: DUF4126 domain-containing protein [Lachnospiraceae bacterium]
MTYSQIFKEIYYENKKFIRAYVAICLAFSILAFASGNLAFASNSFTTVETVSTLGGSFGKVVAPVTQSFLGSIDTPTAMLIFSIISLILDYIPESGLETLESAIGFDFSNYSFGILEFMPVKIFFLVWFLLDKLSKSNRVTCTTGLILENKSKKIGAVVNTLVAASQAFVNIPLGTTVQAASTTSHLTDVVKHSSNALICFVLLMSVLVIYLFIRCLFLFINIILLPVRISVPYFSLGVEGVIGISIIGLIYIAIFHPVIFCIIFALTLIVAIWLFRKAYITIRYFKNIYVKPFFKRFRGYDSEIPLVVPKIPQKVRRYVNESNIDIIIPVYILKKVSGQKFMHWHDRWWFVSAKDKQYICKPCFIKDSCYCIDLYNSDDKKMFIKKSLRFFEVFNLKGTEEDIGRVFRKVHKKIHFVFSKEYYYRFTEIKELTLYTDYTEYRKQIKQSIKLSRAEKREEKRQAKLEAKEERRMARQHKKTLA